MASNFLSGLVGGVGFALELEYKEAEKKRKRAWESLQKDKDLEDGIFTHKAKATIESNIKRRENAAKFRANPQQYTQEFYAQLAKTQGLTGSDSTKFVNKSQSSLTQEDIDRMLESIKVVDIDVKKRTFGAPRPVAGPGVTLPEGGFVSPVIEEKGPEIVQLQERIRTLREGPQTPEILQEIKDLQAEVSPAAPAAGTLAGRQNLIAEKQAQMSGADPVTKARLQKEIAQLEGQIKFDQTRADPKLSDLSEKLAISNKFTPWLTDPSKSEAEKTQALNALKLAGIANDLDKSFQSQTLINKETGEEISGSYDSDTGQLSTIDESGKVETLDSSKWLEIKHVTPKSPALARIHGASIERTRDVNLSAGRMMNSLTKAYKALNIAPGAPATVAPAIINAFTNAKAEVSAFAGIVRGGVPKAEADKINSFVQDDSFWEGIAGDSEVGKLLVANAQYKDAMLIMTYAKLGMNGQSGKDVSAREYKDQLTALAGNSSDPKVVQAKLISLIDDSQSSVDNFYERGIPQEGKEAVNASFPKASLDKLFKDTRADLTGDRFALNPNIPKAVNKYNSMSREEKQVAWARWPKGMRKYIQQPN
jgi:hypothetical protein